MTFVVNRPRIASLLGLTFLAGVLSCSPGSAHDANCPDTTDQNCFDAQRIESAKKLTATAKTLNEQTVALYDKAKRVHVEAKRLYGKAYQHYAGPYQLDGTTIGEPAKPRIIAEKQFKLEADSNQRKISPAAYQKYEDIFIQYKAALAEYQLHRQQYQQHVQAYHKSAQQGSPVQATLEVPPFKPLRVQAQDACDQLQAAEAQLHQNETVLSSVINDLVVHKGQLSQFDYFRRWSEAQRMAMGLQDEAMQFSQGVSQKQTLTTDQLHQITHQAMVDGDYTQSQKAFGEVQRRNAIENQEMNRSNMHSQIASMFMARLIQLNPANLTSSAPTADSITAESQAVAKEFANVQQLYQEMEQLNPSLGK